MFKHVTLSLATCLAVLLLGIGQVFAQATTTGGINGTVKDPQGASIPNATVKVTNTGTNSEVTVTSDNDGGYRVTNLQPGTYSVEVTASGFGPAKAESIIVEVGRSTTIDIPLVLGTATAQVEVTSEAPVINTNDNGNTSNFNQTSINELPINGRRWSNFAILSPSAVPDGTFGLISFRGISGLLNNNTIDGGDNNQAFFSEERGRTRINYVISQSAIREFQVNTSNYSAEYGRSAGGVTNAVTKSGTNEFHGDLFYYNRNNRNGARNPLQFRPTFINGVVGRDAAKPIDLRQQWGGTIGGPIIKDKLFFFFSYDQQKRNFPGLAVFQNANYLVLTTAQLTRLTAVGVTAQEISDTQAFLTSVTGETPRKGDQTLFLPKIDWQVNSNNLFSISYNRLRWKSPAGIQTQAVNNFGRASFGDDFVNVDSLNARLQSNISGSLLNEFRFQYGRDFEFEFSQPPLPGEPLTGHTSLGARSPNVFLTGGLQFGLPNFLERAKFPDEKRWQFADSITWTKGRHTFKFGADLNYVSDDTSNLRNESGGYSYSNLPEFIIDYSHFLNPAAPITACSTTGTGRSPGKCYTSNYVQGIGILGLKVKTAEYNFFGQDDFRVTPRLTVNLGLRWEYIKMPSTPLANSSTAVIPNDGRTLAQATSNLPGDKNNFGPRIGFAYDVFGDGKTSFRGGWGIYYGRIQNSTIYNALINTGNPNGQAQLSVPLAIGLNPNPAAPVFPQILPNNPASFTLGAIQFFSRDFQAPLINQFDVVLEREIMKNTVASVSYIGSLGRSLPTFIDQNLIPCSSLTAADRTAQCPSGADHTRFNVTGGPGDGRSFVLPLYTRANTAFQQLTQIQSSVRSAYNAVVFQINRRFTSGLQFQGSYTLAKSTDTNQNSATFTQNESPYDPFDRSFDAGPSAFDVRHKVVVSAVWAPTFYKGSKNSFYSYLLNGWSFAPIYVFYSGKPFDGTVSGTSLNNSNGDNRFPINPRNAFRLPNDQNIDARLSKRFKFNESLALEVLGEVFNIENRKHTFAENATLYGQAAAAIVGGERTIGLTYQSATFGQVTTTDSTLYRERQIQFSARFQF